MIQVHPEPRRRVPPVRFDLAGILRIERNMKNWKLRSLWASVVVGTLFQGCAIDNDLILRAQLSFVSDVTVFLLENLSRAL